MIVLQLLLRHGRSSLVNIYLFAVFILGGRAAFDSRTCYWKYNIDQGARPCYPPSVKPVSHCCGEGHTCLGDTLCLSNDGPLYLGHCTARNWWNGTTVPEGCPKYLKNCEGMRDFVAYGTAGKAGPK